MADTTDDAIRIPEAKPVEKSNGNPQMVSNITALIMAGIAILGVLVQGVQATAEIIAMKQAMTDLKDSVKEVRLDIKEMMKAKK